MKEQKNDSRSLIMIITSMLIFGTVGIFRRQIPLPSGFLAFWRGLSGGLILLLFTKLKGRRLSFAVNKRKAALLVISGAAMGINWILLFEAYTYTTVSVATLCYYMQPTIVLLLSPLIFKEKMTVRQALCALTALIGMVLVSGVTTGGDPHGTGARGILLALGAAVFYSAVVILNKLIGEADAYEKTIIQLFSAAAVMIPYLILTHDKAGMELTPRVILLLLVIGVVHTGIAYVLYFGSMNGLKTRMIALISYIDPVSALLFSALFLHESLSIAGIIGAVLIIGSAVISETGS